MSINAIDALVERGRGLDLRAEAVQGDDGSHANRETISALVSDYHDWYAEALRVLPDQFEARFRDAYEGGMFTNKIKAFLANPVEASPLFNPETAAFPRWTITYSSGFRGPMLDQLQVLAEAKSEISGAGSSSRDLALLDRVCRRFPEFLDPLAKRGRGRTPFVVTDEYDVQVGLHGILRVLFDDVRPEEHAPSHAGASSRVDFLLKAEKIVVETKMTRDGLTDKKLGEELLVDIERYKAHPDCDALVVLVYDPRRVLNNPNALEADLTGKSGQLVVRVYIVR